jgi:hypothetical protein
MSRIPRLALFSLPLFLCLFSIVFPTDDDYQELYSFDSPWSDFASWPGKDGAVKTNIEFPVEPFLGYELTLWSSNKYGVSLELPLKKPKLHAPEGGQGIKAEIEIHVFPTVELAQNLICSSNTGIYQFKRFFYPPVGDVALGLQRLGYYTLYFSRANVAVYFRYFTYDDSLSIKAFRELPQVIDTIIKESSVWKTGDTAPFISITEKFKSTFTNPSAVTEDHAAEQPQVFTLLQNAPNPFNPSTVISFSLTRPAEVRLAVYDALGREVAVLAEGAFSAGSHEVRWDGHDRTGAPVSSGVYLYRLDAGGKSETRKMLLVR